MSIPVLWRCVAEGLTCLYLCCGGVWLKGLHVYTCAQWNLLCPYAAHAHIIPLYTYTHMNTIIQNAHTHIQTYTHIHTYAHTLTHTHTHANTYTHSHTHSHTHTHIHTHTHTLTGKHYTASADIFSFAITLWEMIARKRPTLEMGMEKADSISILYKMANGKNGQLSASIL